MARSVADCVLLDGIVTGGPLEVVPPPLRGLRLGVPRGHFWQDLDPETALVVEAGLLRLKEAGAVLVEADVAHVAELDQAAGFPIALYETMIDLNAYLADHGGGLNYPALVAQIKSPDVKGMLESLLGAGAVSEAAYNEALLTHRPALRASYGRYFRERDVAALLFPTTPMPATNIGEDDTTIVNGKQVPTFLTYIRNTSPGSVAGLPGLSLPAGMTAAGLPVGLEIDGPEGTDQTLLAIGLSIEALLPKPATPKI
jgi:mandelamide amidase